MEMYCNFKKDQGKSYGFQVIALCLETITKIDQGLFTCRDNHSVITSSWCSRDISLMTKGAK